MFTGIIAARGRLSQRLPVSGDVSLRIDASGLLPPGTGVEGESIAVNGVCLTARDWQGSSFAADVSVETLDCTTLGALSEGDEVNLERALQASDRLGGHMVSGHVDGLAQIRDIQPDARSLRFSLEAPAQLARYIAAKGSVCLDGVSLTVNTVEGALFTVNIIPHTANQTTIAEWAVGRCVNLEVDLVARYLERLLEGDKT